MNMNDAIQRLVDKDEIRDVILLYCRGVDRRDWPLAQSAFFDDATDDHGDFKGPIDEFFAWIEPQHAQVAKSSHVLANCCIQFASNSLAVVESYFIANLELGPEAQGHRKQFASAPGNVDAGRLKLDVFGRYIDRFEKRDGAWRIAKRRVAFDSQHNRPILGNVEANVTWTLGLRDNGDPVFDVLREAGLAG